MWLYLSFSHFIIHSAKIFISLSSYMPGTEDIEVGMKDNVLTLIELQFQGEREIINKSTNKEAGEVQIGRSGEKIGKPSHVIRINWGKKGLLFQYEWSKEVLFELSLNEVL